MPMNDRANMESSAPSSFLPLKKRMRSLNDDNAVAIVATKKVAYSGNAKYKGVVRQQNGHWGAQIYLDHNRIWLGTFKSDAEAALAYDSASLKLGKTLDVNSHRNFPLSDSTVHEPEFQKCYTTEVVLNMIKDGSYPNKFRDFIKIRSQFVGSIVGSKQSEESNKSFSCTQLFQKELTLSDIGKLNRLVIPKKYAVMYLPLLSDDRKERGVEEVEVVLYDKVMTQWKFRYCYWKSSKSFVLTTGWKSFVKANKLKEKDVIVFYTCNVPNNVKTLQGQSNNFMMIDVHRFSDNGLVVPREVNKKVQESSNEELKRENFLKLKLGVEKTKSEESKGGFMLFGVKIQ